MDIVCGYKCVCNDLTSAVVTNTQYAVGIRAFPKPGNGPLAVFKTVTSARKFADGRGNIRIFRCEYQRSKDDRMWRRVPVYAETGELLYSTEVLQAGCAPTGTVFADWVKLDQEVM